MNKILWLLFAAVLIISCVPVPQKIKGTNEYRLSYCKHEADCFKSAEKTCPNGFVITSYRSRPETFVCKN